MDRPARIAVVGPVDDRLVGDLRRLPLRPEVRQCSSLTSDIEALSRFQPDLLAIAMPTEAAEEIGALRLVRQLWPALGVLLVVPAEREVAAAPLAQRLGARVLVHPDAPGQLAALLEQTLLGSDRPRADAFVDLARGIADEVNNPLQFVQGHLQLLLASFESAAERDRRDRVRAAMAGIDRIRTSVDKLRLLAEAQNGPRRREAVDLGALLRAALATRPAAPHAEVRIEPQTLVVNGEPMQLDAAVKAVVQFADELVAAGAAATLEMSALPAACRLRLTANGGLLASWQPPHTFEPFYPSRALRGQSLGLGLFLAQTVVLGHRGQALARRQPDGAIQIDFVMPT